MQENLSKAERKAYKAKRRAEKSQSKFEKFNQTKELTVLCVKFGNKYSYEYVERLRNMISRHLDLPYEFVCLTDDPKPIDGVKSIVYKNQGYSKGWWHKVHMFDPELPLAGRILYFDLDVVIHNNINKLATHETGEFLGIRDFNRKFFPAWKNLNSSVMAFNAGTQSYLYNDFKDNPSQALRLHGDQDWIWKKARNTIKFFPDSWIQSYKWEIRSKHELTIHQGKRNFKNINNNIVVDPECCVAVFHGDPNPCTVSDKFVVDNWR